MRSRTRGRLPRSSQIHREDERLRVDPCLSPPGGRSPRTAESVHRAPMVPIGTRVRMKRPSEDRGPAPGAGVARTCGGRQSARSSNIASSMGRWRTSLGSFITPGVVRWRLPAVERSGGSHRTNPVRPDRAAKPADLSGATRMTRRLRHGRAAPSAGAEVRRKEHLAWRMAPPIDQGWREGLRPYGNSEEADGGSIDARVRTCTRRKRARRCVRWPNFPTGRHGRSSH